MRNWLLSLSLSLALTLVIELSFALLCRYQGRALIYTALVNILTNPVAVMTALLWQCCTVWPLWPAVIIVEALVFLTEGLIYQRSPHFSHPWLFSLTANVLSFGLGLVLNIIF